jgi:HEAT repeat protein
MGIDLENFGLGLAAGWGSAYLLYRSRKAIQSAAESVREGAQKVQNSATRSADSRFINDLVSMCESAHLAAAHVKLSDILVEPMFIPAPEFAAPGEEDMGNVLRIIPQFHDHPYLHSVYNVDALTINDLASGERAVAILGAQGSGRTTALMAIALQSLGKKTFKPPFDVVQERLDKEESELSEKQRAVRVKERVLMEQRARERLASEKGMAWNAEIDVELKNQLPLFNRLMPIYVHMGNLNFGTQNHEFGSEVDPAELIVRAVQYSVGRVTASTIPRYLYERLNEGQVLLLIDGYDSLPEIERPMARAWLKALMQQYKENFIIVTGPVTGYSGLTSLGFTPVFLRPWNDLDTRACVYHWAQSWGQIGRKRRRAAKPDEDAVERARANSRGFNPFEIAIKTWANFAGDAEKPGFEGWLQAFLTRQLELDKDFPLAQLLPNLSRLATLQLDEGYITIQRLQALRISGEAFGIKDTQADPSVEAASANVSETQAASKTADGDGDKNAAEKKEEDIETASSQGRLLGLLRANGLLVRYRGDRYQFRQSLLASYLASLTFKDMSRDTLKAKSTHPAWKHSFAYAAAHTNLDHLVKDRLTAPSDVLHNNVIETARWLAFAPLDVAWRGAVLKLLTDMLTATSEFPLIRQRATAALLDTRDTKNVSYIFRRAVRNLSPEVRVLSALGMGATGDPETAKDLIPLLDDQSTDVRVAASVALGALATEEALEAIVIAFTENQEPVRQAIAEQLALLPEEGHAVLYDAMREREDMGMRRAAVFGLRRTRTVWGLIEIYRAFLEDEQWYVRSAAQNAFEEIQFGRINIPTQKYPAIDQIQWLSEWAAEKGEKLPPGEGAKDMLLRALVEGDPGVRILAARNIGQLGQPLMIKPLYNALRDRQDSVRLAAHRALADFQMQLGKPLPAPV